MPFFSNVPGPAGRGQPQRAGLCQPQPQSQGGDREKGDGRKRGSVQLSPRAVSMAMAQEAGENFLSGNTQRRPFTVARATLATLAAERSGCRGSRGGTWGQGLPVCLPPAALRAVGESVKPHLAAKGGRAAGVGDPR